MHPALPCPACRHLNRQGPPALVGLGLASLPDPCGRRIGGPANNSTAVIGAGDVHFPVKPCCRHHR